MGRAKSEFTLAKIADGDKVILQIAYSYDHYWPFFSIAREGKARRYPSSLFIQGCEVDTFNNKECTHVHSEGNLIAVPDNFLECIGIKTEKGTDDIIYWYLNDQEIARFPLWYKYGGLWHLHEYSYDEDTYRYLYLLDHVPQLNEDSVLMRRYDAEKTDVFTHDDWRNWQCNIDRYYFVYNNANAVWSDWASIESKAKSLAIPSDAIKQPTGIDLTAKIADSLDKNPVSNLQNIKDLKDLSGFIPEISRGKYGHIKTVADLILWWKYTMSTTGSDIAETMAYLTEPHKKSNSLRAAGYKVRFTQVAGTDAVTEERQSISYQNPILTLADITGIHPGNAEDWWDLVPFSFVLDWFTNIGEIFKSLDDGEAVTQISVLSSVYSTKTTCVHCFDGQKVPFIGQLKTTGYCRYVNWPIETEVKNFRLHCPDMQKHGLELGALITSLLLK